MSLYVVALHVVQYNNTFVLSTVLFLKSCQCTLRMIMSIGINCIRPQSSPKKPFLFYPLFKLMLSWVRVGCFPAPAALDSMYERTCFGSARPLHKRHFLWSRYVWRCWSVLWAVPAHTLSDLCSVTLSCFRSVHLKHLRSYKPLRAS